MASRFFFFAAVVEGGREDFLSNGSSDSKAPAGLLLTSLRRAEDCTRTPRSFGVRKDILSEAAKACASTCSSGSPPGPRRSETAMRVSAAVNIFGGPSCCVGSAALRSRCSTRTNGDVLEGPASSRPRGAEEASVCNEQ